MFLSLSPSLATFTHTHVHQFKKKLKLQKAVLFLIFQNISKKSDNIVLVASELVSNSHLDTKKVLKMGKIHPL